MESGIPIKRFLTGIGGHFDVPDECRTILQMIVFELDNEGKCITAEKIRLYDNKHKYVVEAILEE
jgi:calcineurin-like phosphoesterase